MAGLILLLKKEDINTAVINTHMIIQTPFIDINLDAEAVHELLIDLTHWDKIIRTTQKYESVYYDVVVTEEITANYPDTFLALVSAKLPSDSTKIIIGEDTELIFMKDSRYKKNTGIFDNHEIIVDHSIADKDYRVFIRKPDIA